MSIGDILKSGETKHLRLTLTFDADADTLPSEPVEVTGLTTSIIYSQNTETP